MFHCPQCDFLSQNERYFNDHVSKVHANQPTCPFCFIAFDNFPSVRKHCELQHKEMKGEKQPMQKEVIQKPCRFFRNGSGQCSPPSGICDYDHSIIPDNERAICFNKQACTFKPFCIFSIRKDRTMKSGNKQKKNFQNLSQFIERRNLYVFCVQLLSSNQQE